MTQIVPNALKQLWNEQMRRWNEWQKRVGESPAKQLDFRLQQALDFQMSHRLANAEALLWMEKQLAEKGLGAIHTLWLPEREPKREHDLAIFRTGTDGYGILEGHHRLVAACLMAYRQRREQWLTPIRLRLHTPDEETIRLWRASVPEIDGQMLARFPMLRGASVTVGTIREFLADGQWTPEGRTP
jgi:hypothetical protein